MAKEIVAWCDVCLHDNEEQAVRQPGEEVVVAFGTLKPRSLDLCERHRKEFVDPLRDLIADLGVIADSAKAAITPSRSSKPSSSRGASGPLKCPVPDCIGGPYADARSWRTHMNGTHGLKVKEVRALYGDPEPVSADEMLDLGTAEQEDANGRSKFACDVDGCDKDYPPSQYGRPAQALAVHRATAHGIKGKSRASQAKYAKDEKAGA